MDLAECSPHGGFLHEAGVRLRTRWVVKFIGLSLGMTAFFAVYFRLLNHPAFAVTVMPLTPLDGWIGFHPGALSLYVSLWIYVPLAFALIGDDRALLGHSVATVVLAVTGLGVFFLWPTAVPNLGTDWSSHPAFSFLKAVDASGNACPSLHVAFAVLTAARMSQLLREMRAHGLIRVGNVLWCAGIIYSTLATGQHVVIDAVAGIVLGLLVAALPFLHSPHLPTEGRSRPA